MATTTEKKRAVSASTGKRDIQETDRWLEIFSIFVHDLESPFASVKYLLQKIESGKFDPRKRRHQMLVRSSRIAVERTETILYDIMAVARAGKTGIPVELANLVPDAIIREAIDLASNSAEENGVGITFTNNAGNIAVRADPKLLKRTLDNLIYNAVRHTPGGSTISVYTEPAVVSVLVHVKDSGPGLAGIDSEQLFEKYGQIQLRSEGKHRGIGLGLYFCKLAAAGMGGRISAADHPKGGAVFTVELVKAEV